MGRSHALSGAVAGLALAPAARVTQPGEVLLLAVVTAGFALLPDLDHPGASASRLLGPATEVASRVLRTLSQVVYRLTKGPRDEHCTGRHRHLSHCALFAAAVGLGIGAGSRAGGAWAVAGVLLLAVLLAQAALGDWVLPAAVLAGIWWAVVAPDPAGLLTGVTGWVGLAAAVGCLVHDLGDSLTSAGCPILFPLPIRGETWYELRPPRPIRFRTDGPAERLLVFPALLVAAVLLLPGIWPIAHRGLTAALTAVTGLTP
jgi:hypothetical protein